MSRNLESRVSRLEENADNNDADMFLVWCKAGQNIAKAFAQACHHAGLTMPAEIWPQSVVACSYWVGEGEMPAPRWTTVEEMTEDELRILIYQTRDRLLTDGVMTKAEWDELDARYTAAAIAPR